MAKVSGKPMPDQSTLEAQMLEQFGGTEQPAESEARAPQPAVKPAVKTSAVLIEVPISPELPPTQFGVHIDTHLTGIQATTIRQVAAQLDRRLAVLKNGKRVVNVTDAVKYLIELIAAETRA